MTLQDVPHESPRELFNNDEIELVGVALARMMPSNMKHIGTVTADKVPTYATYDEVIEGLREAGPPLELIDKLHGNDPATLTIEEYGTSPYDDPALNAFLRNSPHTLSRIARSTSEASAKLSLGASTKSPEPNAPHTLQIHDMVKLIGKRSSCRAPD